MDFEGWGYVDRVTTLNDLTLETLQGAWAKTVYGTDRPDVIYTRPKIAQYLEDISLPNLTRRVSPDAEDVAIAVALALNPEADLTSIRKRLHEAQRRGTSRDLLLFGMPALRSTYMPVGHLYIIHESHWFVPDWALVGQGEVALVDLIVDDIAKCSRPQRQAALVGLV